LTKLKNKPPPNVVMKISAKISLTAL